MCLQYKHFVYFSMSILGICKLTVPLIAKYMENLVCFFLLPLACFPQREILQTQIFGIQYLVSTNLLPVLCVESDACKSCIWYIPNGCLRQNTICPAEWSILFGKM